MVARSTDIGLISPGHTCVLPDLTHCVSAVLLFLQKWHSSVVVGPNLNSERSTASPCKIGHHLIISPDSFVYLTPIYQLDTGSLAIYLA